jgi:uncharacterized protein (TIGR03086 family)
MELLAALDTAADEFRQRVVLVGDSDWARSTPCPDWDVQYLVAHVVGGNRFAKSILGGMSASDAIAEVMSAQQLADDAVGACVATSAAQLAAFRADGALEQRIDHPLGEITGREFLEFRVFDTTLHAWDLARALGADEHIMPELVEAVLTIIENGPPGMGFGIVALGIADAGSPPLVRVLDLSGRRAT